MFRANCWTAAGHVLLTAVSDATHIAAPAVHSIFLTHVKGQSGHPWNEYVDCLASASHKGEVAHIQSDFVVDVYESTSAHQQIWAAEIASGYDSPPPPPVYGGSLIITPSLPSQLPITIRMRATRKTLYFALCDSMRTWKSCPAGKLTR